VSYSPVGAQTYTKLGFSAFYSHFQVNSGQVRWRYLISCHVTGTSCELQPWRSSNVHKTRVFGFLQPLWGDFRWNDVTSG